VPEQKPLPATPIAAIEPIVQQQHYQTQIQTQTATETHHQTHRPESEYEPVPEVKKFQLKALEAKHADGRSIPLSDCTGERRAVLIGINYTGHANALHGRQ